MLKRILPAGIIRVVWAYRSLGIRNGLTFMKRQFLREIGLCSTRRTMPVGLRSILFVCHGNIIRSPMTAALMRRYLPPAAQQTLSIASAGLHTKDGREADRRALIVAKEFGISLNDHRAQQLSSDLVRNADVIFVMDFFNEAELLGLYPWASRKVLLIGNCLAEEPIESPTASLEVLDPYEGDTTDVRRCYGILDSRIRSLAAAISEVKTREQE